MNNENDPKKKETLSRMVELFSPGNYERYCSDMHIFYLLTKNPMFAWRVIFDSNFYGYPTPGWVQDYLVQSASDILNADTGDLQKIVSESLGFSAKQGGKNSLKEFKMIKKNICFYYEIEELKAAGVPVKNCIIETIASYGYDYKTAERYYYKTRRLMFLSD